MQFDSLVVLSLVVSISAILLTLWQTLLTRRALDFQAYLGLETLQKSHSLSDGVRAIRTIPNYDDYKTFLNTESLETQQAIRDTVIFLNAIAHIVNEGFLGKYRVWRRFFFTYKLCYEKLYPWYIEGLRDTRYEGENIAYATFEGMCLLVAEADKSKAVRKRLWKRQLNHLGRSALKGSLEKRKSQEVTSDNVAEQS
jgi:hypothetical protein